MTREARKCLQSTNVMFEGQTQALFNEIDNQIEVCDIVLVLTIASNGLVVRYPFTPSMHELDVDVFLIYKSEGLVGVTNWNTSTPQLNIGRADWTDAPLLISRKNCSLECEEKGGEFEFKIIKEGS